jgi:aminoglycoside 3-N-acetyltransferase
MDTHQAGLRRFAKRLLPLLPRSLQTRLRQEAERRRLREHAARKQRTQVAGAEILAGLAALDIDRDFMVHASISSIGRLDQPVGQLVRAWLTRLHLDRQTMLCPALPYNTTMHEYLEGLQAFDLRTARNAMGAVSQIVMAEPGALRSLHPSHSVVALGTRARYYVTDHHRDETPFGPGSPYWKLTENRGQIVLLGVGLNAVTCFHVAEDLLGDHLPRRVYLSRRYRVPCIDAEGTAWTVATACHDPALSAVRDCERARRHLEDAGAIRSRPVGEAELAVIDARLFTLTLLRMLEQGLSIYGRVSLTRAQRQAVAAARERLA